MLLTSFVNKDLSTGDFQARVCCFSRGCNDLNITRPPKVNWGLMLQTFDPQISQSVKGTIKGKENLFISFISSWT